MFDDCTTVWDLTRRLCEELDAQIGGAGCIVSRVIGDVLVQVAEHAPDGRTFQLGRGFLVSQFPTTARVLEEGAPQAVSVDDENPDPAETAVLHDLSVRAVLMLALPGRGTAWGLVELYRNEPSAYDDDEVARASAIVASASDRLQRLI